MLASGFHQRLCKFYFFMYHWKDGWGRRKKRGKRIEKQLQKDNVEIIEQGLTSIDYFFWDQNHFYLTLTNQIWSTSQWMYKKISWQFITSSLFSANGTHLMFRNKRTIAGFLKYFNGPQGKPIFHLCGNIFWSCLSMVLSSLWWIEIASSLVWALRVAWEWWPVPGPRTSRSELK